MARLLEYLGSRFQLLFHGLRFRPKTVCRHGIYAFCNEPCALRHQFVVQGSRIVVVGNRYPTGRNDRPFVHPRIQHEGRDAGFPFAVD